jgi:hypothetical protein
VGSILTPQTPTHPSSQLLAPTHLISYSVPSYFSNSPCLHRRHPHRRSTLLNRSETRIHTSHTKMPRRRRCWRTYQGRASLISVLHWSLIYSLSRFILNLPDEELNSLERLCFQVEQACVPIYESVWVDIDFSSPLVIGSTKISSEKKTTSCRLCL